MYKGTTYWYEYEVAGRCRHTFITTKPGIEEVVCPVCGERLPAVRVLRRWVTDGTRRWDEPVEEEGL